MGSHKDTKLFTWRMRREIYLTELLRKQVNLGENESSCKARRWRHHLEEVEYGVC
jgi:hypothetical protein